MRLWISYRLINLYRSAMKKEAAIKELKKDAETKFDPILVKHFVDILNQE
ncbi:hypothetical protein A45J_1943 [hot springs metagenome]|uniref:Uncharacterized protein n=1 Tax=hot springs metagenome TaxID=433727 RepID=A0A5J4KY32_9ZZZZ